MLLKNRISHGSYKGYTPHFLTFLRAPESCHLRRQVIEITASRRAALPDAQAETADHRVSITKDVPILRIDHFSIKGKLLGVWQAFHSSGVRDIRNETLTRSCITRSQRSLLRNRYPL